MSTGLPERLRNETRTLHTEVERGPFMGEMLRGQLGRAAYCLFLRSLHAIYVALEDALEQHATHPMVAPVFAPALRRSAALARDLQALHGADWQQSLATQPACGIYVARLQQLAQTSPALLVAHAYVRYLGDLSGGQILRRIIADSLQLGSHAGTAFYDFGDADQTRALTQEFRHGLTKVAADEAQTNLIVHEALAAFGLHRTLFEQLALAGRGERTPVAIGR